LHEYASSSCVGRMWTRGDDRALASGACSSALPPSPPPSLPPSLPPTALCALLCIAVQVLDLLGEISVDARKELEDAVAGEEEKEAEKAKAKAKA
jgi:hypothetical protein